MRQHKQNSLIDSIQGEIKQSEIVEPESQQNEKETCCNTMNIIQNEKL